MLNTAGVERNTTSPDLIWKTVTKGRRSRRLNPRSLSRGVKMENRSPKRVGDFSSSEPDMSGEAVAGQHISNKVEHIPIKKRRCLLQSSSPSLVPSGYCEESSSPESLITPTQSEELVGHHLNKDSYSSQQLHKCAGVSTLKFLNDIKDKVIDVKLAEVTNRKYDNSGDFSGIALLAAAALNDGVDFNPGSVEGDSTPFPLKPILSQNNSLDLAEEAVHPDTKVDCSAALKKSQIISQDLSAMAENGESMRSLSPKIDRIYWDLNTSMDSWEQPHDDDTVRISAANNVICNEMHIEKVETDIPEEQRGSDICRDNASNEGLMETCELTDDKGHIKKAASTVDSKVLDDGTSDCTSSKHVNLSASKSSEEEGVSITGKEDRVSTPIMITTDSRVQFESKAGNNSPFEDGEVRGSDLYSWEENEVDYDYEMECIDYGSDGDDGVWSAAADHSGSEVVEAGSAGTETRNSSGSIHEEADYNKSWSPKNLGGSEKIDIGGNKESDADSGNTARHRADMSIEENIGVRNRRHATDHTNAYGHRQTFKDETNRKDTMLLHNCSPRGECGPYARPKKNFSSERFVGRYRSGPYTRNRDAHNGNWVYWDPTNHYKPVYNGSENHGHSWQRRFPASADREFQHQHQNSINYSSKVAPRSRFDRDDCVEVPGRRLPMRGGITSNNRGGRGSRRYTQQFGRVFTQEGEETLPDDIVSKQYHLPSRNHSFSHFSGRAGHISLPRRSRTNSQAWDPQRDRIVRTRPNRSLDSRVPFQKSHYAVDHGEGFTSSTRGHHFSPYQNSRWPGNRNYMGNHLRYRSPPPGNMRTHQRFDGVESGRYPRVAGIERGFKLEDNRNHERRGGGRDMMHKTKHSDGSFVRQHHVADDNYKAAGNSQTVEEFHSADQSNVP